jgi:UDP-glucuronate 4-epimerase
MEQHLGITAQKEYLGMQPGDVEKTFADTTLLEEDYGYRAGTELDKGIGAFVKWYRGYYKR